MIKVIIPHYDPVLYINLPESSAISSSTASSLNVNSNPVGNKNIVFPIKFIYRPVPISINGVFQEVSITR